VVLWNHLVSLTSSSHHEFFEYVNTLGGVGGLLL